MVGKPMVRPGHDKPRLVGLIRNKPTGTAMRRIFFVRITKNQGGIDPNSG
jgi:hypothetical protein